MPALKYVGPFDEIEVVGHVVKRGDSFDVDDAAVAKSLLAQADNFEASKSATKNKES